MMIVVSNNKKTSFLNNSEVLLWIQESRQNYDIYYGATYILTHINIYVQ